MMNIMAMWISNSTIMGGSIRDLPQVLGDLATNFLTFDDTEVGDRLVSGLKGHGQPLLCPLDVALVVADAQMGLRHTQQEDQFAEGFHASM